MGGTAKSLERRLCWLSEPEIKGVQDYQSCWDDVIFLDESKFNHFGKTMVCWKPNTELKKILLDQQRNTAGEV